MKDEGMIEETTEATETTEAGEMKVEVRKIPTEMTTGIKKSVQINETVMKVKLLKIEALGPVNIDNLIYLFCHFNGRGRFSFLA